MVPPEPQDKSDWNLIVGTTFRTAITAEGIDVKEFTSNGTICGNYLSGDALTGANSAISQVVIKGNNWRVVGGNKGVGGMSGDKIGTVYRTAYQDQVGWGINNTFAVDTCQDMPQAKACVYIGSNTYSSTVDCITMTNMGSVPVSFASLLLYS